MDDLPGGDDVPLGQLNSIHTYQRSPEERKKDVDDILDEIHSKKDN